MNSKRYQRSWSQECAAAEIPEGSRSSLPEALVGGMELGCALLLANNSYGAGFLGDLTCLAIVTCCPQELRFGL